MFWIAFQYWRNSPAFSGFLSALFADSSGSVSLAAFDVTLKALNSTGIEALLREAFSGYKQLMTQGVTEVGCLGHARRKFFDLHASNKSQIAQSALEQIARIYDIERQIAARLLSCRLCRRRFAQPALSPGHDGQGFSLRVRHGGLPLTQDCQEAA
jgi:hypothetical protein